jgi:hypothetical protein
MGGGINMGLDSVELVMAIEEEFGVDIPDQDAENMITVGDVYDWVKLRIATSTPMACLTQRVFYKLRRALVENYSVSRHTIKPETRLTDLLPVEVVEDGWPFLQMFIDLKTPPFKVANEILGFRLSHESLTMRELVDALIMINGKALSPQVDSEEEVWRRLVKVFVRQLSLNPEEVKYHARIARDLGVD